MHPYIATQHTNIPLQLFLTPFNNNRMKIL